MNEDAFASQPYDDPWLDIQEHAAYRRTTPAAIHTERSRGNGPPAVRDGKRLLWRLSDIDRYLEGRKKSPAEPRRPARASS